MKKTFSLLDDKIKPDRKVEAIRGEIKKYIARERRKTIPEGYEFWSFDCKFGPSEDEAVVIAESEIKRCIGQITASNQTSFYLEIIARADKKPAK